MRHKRTFWTPIARLAALGLLLAAPARAQDAVGINIHLPPDDEVDAAAALGVSWVRVDANWLQLEPRQGRFEWGAMDRVVDRARAQGMEVFMTLAYAPAWASAGNDDDILTNDVPRPGLYEAFVRAAVSRYQDRVTHYGIWNEPNLRQFWAGDRRTYVERVLRPGAAAVKAVCPTCKVLGPDLAGTSGWQDYLEAVLRDAGEVFDIVTHHTYARVRGARGGVQWICDDFEHAIDIGDDAICFYKPGLRQVLDQVGWRRTVWLTEVGYRTRPWDSGGEQEAQRITVEGVLALQRATPWWTHTFFYELSDCGPTQPECPIDGYGLIRRTGAPDGTWADNFFLKPAFTWLRDLLAGPDWRRMQPPAEPPPPPPPPPATVDAPQRAAGVPDGLLDDWDADGCVALNRWEAVADAGRPGAADLSARACAAWSPDALWLAVEVVDDVHDNPHPDELLWQGDSVQLAVDLDADGGEQGYDEDDAEWTLALVNGASRVRPEHGARPATGVVRREGERTRYELSVPLPGLRAGRALRASFLVNEADGSGREGWLEWTPGIGRAKQPGRFGAVTLVARAAAPPMDGPPEEEEDAQPRPPVPVRDAGPPAEPGDPSDLGPVDPVDPVDPPVDPNDPQAGTDGGTLPLPDRGATVRPGGGGAPAAEDSGCQAGPGAPPAGLGLLLLGLLGRRSRRRR